VIAGLGFAGDFPAGVSGVAGMSCGWREGQDDEPDT